MVNGGNSRTSFDKGERDDVKRGTKGVARVEDVVIVAMVGNQILR